MIQDSVSLNPLDLTDRHFLITGASSGIGRASAKLLRALGAHLSLVDLDSDGMNTLLDELGDGVTAFTADLAEVEQIATLVNRSVESGGQLNGFVHCAGIQSISPLRSIKSETWRRMMAINAEAALALGKAMASKKVYSGENGSIVLISSVTAARGAAGAVPYSMSKSALEGMARSMALEFAPRSLRVNCIAPGFVKTPLFHRTERTWDEAQRLSVEKQHPLGFGEPEDIANAVAFLLADTGRWITGSVLVVDGGYLAR